MFLLSCKVYISVSVIFLNLYYSHVIKGKMANNDTAKISYGDIKKECRSCYENGAEEADADNGGLECPFSFPKKTCPAQGKYIQRTKKRDCLLDVKIYETESKLVLITEKESLV